MANPGPFGWCAGIATTSLKYARHHERKVRAGVVVTSLPGAGGGYHVPLGGTRKATYGACQ